MTANKPWWAELESRLFTRYKTKLKTALGQKFTDLNCTMSPMTKAASKFPTAYFHMIDWTEALNDLQNTETNAILAGIQIDLVTGLTSPEHVTENIIGNIYDMQGRIVMTSGQFAKQKNFLPTGIYIRNGRKFVVK